MEILNMVVMEGLSERKTFIQRLEGGKGVSHGAMWGESFQTRETASAKVCGDMYGLHVRGTANQLKWLK